MIKPITPQPQVVALPPVEMVTSGAVQPADVAACDEKVDIWALGVTIYELLTGALRARAREHGVACMHAGRIRRWWTLVAHARVPGMRWLSPQRCPVEQVGAGCVARVLQPGCSASARTINTELLFRLRPAAFGPRAVACLAATQGWR